jgi:hypothetical protein
VDVKTSGNRGNRAVSGYRPEYLRLNKPYELCKIYDETKGNLDSFLTFYKMTVDSGMCIQEVVKAAKISNCNLPSMERRYATLLSEVNVLQFRKQRLE